MNLFVFKIFWALTVLLGAASGVSLGFAMGRRRVQRQWDLRDEQEVLMRRLNLIHEIGAPEKDQRTAAWN